MMPNHLPPWEAVYQQAPRRLRTGVFESLACDLRELLGVATGRSARPPAAVSDSRTLRPSPRWGSRAGYDGAKRREGGERQVAAETRGHLRALLATPAGRQDRAQARRVGRAGARGDGRERGTGLGRPRLHGRGRRQAIAQGPHLGVVRLPEAVAGLYLMAFAILRLKRLAGVLAQSS